MPTSMTYEKAAELMREAGAEHGRNAASWYFDGNTRQETYAAVLAGIEEGDPEILETFPSNPLSGEWADDPTPTSVFRDVLGLDVLGLDAHAEATFQPETFDELLSEYEEGFSQAVNEEIERVARFHLS